MILFFRSAIYDFTYNNEGKFSASQICLLFDLPSQNNLNSFKKINVLSTPPALHGIELDADLLNQQYVEKGFREMKAGFAPVRARSIGRNIQSEKIVWLEAPRYINYSCRIW